VADLDDLEDGRSFRKYSISSQQRDPLESSRPEIRGIANRIYQKWAGVDLNLLLDHVYFETAPMLTAQRSRRLDFSQIPLSRESEGEPVRDFSAIIPREKQQAVLSRIRQRRKARTHLRTAWHLSLEEGDLEDLKRLEEDDDASSDSGGTG